MKILALLLSVSFLAQGLKAQFYYKDIVMTWQTRNNWKDYQANHISSVVIHSYDAAGEPMEGFEGTQKIKGTGIETFTRTNIAGESLLTTSFNAQGQLLQTVDTAEDFRSTTTYNYDADGHMSRITNVSKAPGQPALTEVHEWSYTADGDPKQLLRIKDQSDTTTITFVLNEDGQVTEEHGTHLGSALPVIYYYYDETGLLTDIVRFNERAQRLLPDYVFEYNAQEQMTSMLVVPEGSSDYQKWVYEYNEKGLKTKETCYNKRRQVLGRVEYEYK